MDISEMIPESDLQNLDGECGGVHIVLIGDSTLDNGRYLNLARGELSVEKQLTKSCIDKGWDMTVLAQDGSMLEDVRHRQLPLIPEAATHIILSASGNDLLSLLNQMVVANFTMSSMYSTIGTGLTKVSEDYGDILQELKALGCHLACCTLYRPNFNHFFFKSLATFSLGVHNGRITQKSVETDCSVIDFANIFEAPDDFANPLELSTRGGSKVVANIVAFVNDHPISRLRRRFPNIYTDDDAFVPSAMSQFGLPLRCCATRMPLHKVYASTVVPESLAAPDTALAGGSLEPALAFSQAQEQWRNPSDRAEDLCA